MKTVVAGLTYVCLSLIAISLFFAGQSSAKIDPETAIGIWLFDEGKGDVAADSSGNGNDGTLKNGPKWVAGKFGKALEFDGVDAHVYVEHVQIPPKGWSISSWVNWSGVVNGIWISHNNTDSANNNLHLFFRNDGKPEIDYFNNAMVANSLVDKGVWTHIVFVVEPNGNRKAYINAKLDKTDANTVDYTGDTAPLYIGKFYNRCQYKGLVDEVAIFNVALKEEDIQTIMAKGFMGMLSIAPSGKLTTTWALIKAH